MHIVQLIPELKQGGVETVGLALNREMVRAGHRSTVISAGGKLVAQIEADGGKHIELDLCSKNPITFPARIYALRHALCALRPAPTILHAHSRVPAWLTRFANKRLHIPWVTTVHGFNSISRYSAIMTKGDRVICVSNPVKEHILKNYPVDPGRIRVIHGGIEPQAFDPLNVDQSAVNDILSTFDLAGKTVVSSIGRITELKDYETFIRAIGIASKANPDLRGLIVGHVRKDKKEYFERLNRLVEELQLKDIIHIATTLTNMPAVYAVSQVIVSCSRKPESFGLTLIEALAMNTPVIATRHGGPLDIIQEGQNGHFFPPCDAAALATLLADPPPITSSDLRADTLDRFGIDRMIGATLQVYEEATTSR